MSAPTISFRCHFDGTVIIPDEPVILPLNKSIELLVKDSAAKATRELKNDISDEEVARSLAALARLVSMAAPDAHIPDEALRRENMYEDRV